MEGQEDAKMLPMLTAAWGGGFNRFGSFVLNAGQSGHASQIGGIERLGFGHEV
jgi:hypothetical protein